MASFNAKDLTYDKQEPAFLRKLRGEVGGDRHNVQFARPKKDRLKTGDQDEDEPTIVDESGETLDKDEWERMLKGAKDGEAEGRSKRSEIEVSRDLANPEEERVEAQRAEQKVAEIGANKKRKHGKVIGTEDSKDEAENTGDTGVAKNAVIPKDNKADRTVEAAPKSKKKGKKIKLSFDEPEDG